MRLSSTFVGSVAVLLVVGCEPPEPDEGRLARLEEESRGALVEVRAAQRALRAYDSGGRLEELEARHDAETRRMEAGEVPAEEVAAWRVMMDSVRIELDVLNTAPLNLESATSDSVLIRLRSEYYGAQDRYTLTRLAIGFADGQ